MKKAIALLALFSVAVFAKGKSRIYAEIQEREFELTDKRDGKTYKTVKIGDQVWMAENLNYDAEGSKCYENKPENCKKYGRLYNWWKEEACPNGWHLPDNNEWQTLVDFAGGNEVAGKKLKAKSGWNQKGNGTDEYGFSALPGGSDDGFDGSSFSLVGSVGIWWSADKSNSHGAYHWIMSYYHDGAGWDDFSLTSALFSVRCVQN